MGGRLLVAGLLAALLVVCVGPAGAATQLLGSSVVQAGLDSDAAGQAEAFRTAASASGTVSSLSVYVDTGNAATTLVAGVYADSSGRPGTLLGQASRPTPAAGAWNTLTFASPFAVTGGQTYWIAVLGAGGKLAFRDCHNCASAGSVSSSQTGLTSLPASWSSGSVWNDGTLSAYALAGASDTTPPSTPTGLAVSNVTASALTLSWQASSDNVGVAGYKTFLNGAAAATTSGLSSTFTGLGCGSTYTLGVAAYDAAGNQSATATMSASTSPCADTSPPSAPGGLAVSGVSSSAMTLSWNASSDNVGVAGYGALLNGSQVTTTSSLSYTYTGLACGTSYTLGVNAYDAAGNTSAPSSTSASTLACAARPVPVAAYSFDEGTGSSAADASGHGNTGTLVNATWAPRGKYGGAASFNGSNALVSVRDSSSLELSGQMTLEAWVDPSAFANTWDVVLSKTQQGDLVYALYARSNLNAPAGLIFSNGSQRVLNGTGPLPIGSWSFLAASFDGASLKLYLNGVLVSQLAYTGAITASTGPLTIGGDAWGQWFSGLIDNLRIYNRALTPSELQTDMNTPVGSAGPAVPANTSPPVISGSTVVGSILSSSTGSWSGSPSSYAYQWQRCDSSGASCILITGANASTYTLASADQGKTIRVQVTASNSAGSASSLSAQTPLVTTGTASPTPVPAASTPGVTVGGGFTDATARQVVRTANNTVYIIAADDNPCQGGGRAVIRVWKGTGAQPGNANVPTGFVEQDSAHHPVASGSADCTYTGGVAATLGNPDSRLDKSGLIQLAYIEGGTANVYYQTYSTVTDSWGARTLIGSGAGVSDGRSWPRIGQVALSLDSNDQPIVVYPTAGGSNTLNYTRKGTGGWSTPTALASGTNVMHPSMVTSRDGTQQLAWLDNSLAAHARVMYSHYNGSSWSTPELVSAGDSVVLSNGDGDQGPSIAADTSNRPHVLYMDGTSAGPDDYVRMRYRASSGSWTDNTPPGGAGGASNPGATLFAHTPQNYIAANNDNYVFLGHDVNIEFGYQYQLGGVGSTWGPYTTLDPHKKTSPAPGDTCEPGTDGSASIRFDPLRDNNPGIVDVLYYDERDNSDCAHHHATVYYKAIVIN